MRCLAVALAVAAACTSSGPGPNAVTVTVVGEPSVIVYRNFDGPWLMPGAGDQPGDFVLHVTDAYTLVLTCSDATGFDTVVRSRTFDDGDTDFIYCDGHATALPDSATVTGQMQQAGTVSMYDIQQSLTAPWNFQLAVPAGTRDLSAYSGDKVMLRRDLAISDGAQLAPVDVDRDGLAVVPVQLVLDNIAPGDFVTSEMDLYGANNLAWGPNVEGTIAQAIPTALLRDSDQQDLVVTATSQDGQFARTVDTWFDGTQSRFQLMPTLAGVTLAGATARWGALPSHTAVSLDLIVETTTTYSAERISATQAWLDETGASELAEPELPPKLPRELTIDPASQHATSFTARDDSTAIAYETTINDAAAAARQLTSARRRMVP
jgi:hypothetical protein